jgi:signal transduction histidine kinase
MGLYMAKMIIENNMDGILDVSNVNNGAEFIIRFKIENKKELIDE